MKVAFLTHEPFYPPSGGGSAEALYLVQEMVQRGHEVHVFCPSFPEPDKVERMLAAQPATLSRKPTPDPSQPPSRRSGAIPPSPPASARSGGSEAKTEARREGGEGNRSGGLTSLIGGAEGGLEGGLRCHLFTTWQMSRYTSLRNFKYLAYPYFLQRLVERAARRVRFELVLSQHAISAVAAGRLKQRLRLPVVMNFLDYLTGFMETWPRYLAPRSFIQALERFELSMPTRYQADGVMTVSDTLADYFADAGYARERIVPIYYGYDAKLFRPAGPDGGAENGRGVTVVMHGSFDQHHLGPIAADSLRHVYRNRPGVRFKFVGKQTPALSRFCQKMEAAIPGLQIECTGFVPYAEIAGHIAGATVGIVPYEESTGTHCAFVAKIVEYLGAGLPVVSTPLNSARRYFNNEPAIRFSEFNGMSFGQQILSWLDEPTERRRTLSRAASQRVQVELDWSRISKKAIDFVEKIQQQQRRI